MGQRPLERAGRVLKSLGLGSRVVKTSLAAGLAWWLGNLLGEPQPVFAAIAAIVALETTVATSVARAVEQTVGVLGGLLLAAVLLPLSGSQPLTIALVILIAMAIGARLKLKPSTHIELAITGLLVVVYTDPSTPYFGLQRVWEGVLGGAIAVLVNALVLPPEYMGHVRYLFREFVEITARAVVRAVDDVLDGAGAADVSQRLAGLRSETQRLSEERATLERAREAFRFSPLRRDGRESADRFIRGMDVLEPALAHSLTAARVAWQHARRQAQPRSLRQPGVPAALADMAVSTAAALREYAAWVETGSAVDLSQASAAVNRARDSRANFMEAAHVELQQAGELEVRVDVAALESELEHVLDDLTMAVDQELQRLAREPRAVGAR